MYVLNAQHGVVFPWLSSYLGHMPDLGDLFAAVKTFNRFSSSLLLLGQ